MCNLTIGKCGPFIEGGGFAPGRFRYANWVQNFIANKVPQLLLCGALQPITRHDVSVEHALVLGHSLHRIKS